MKDWKRIAQSSGIAIPAEDLDRVAASLAALEEVTRPLYDNLGPESEPATLFFDGAGSQ